MDEIQALRRFDQAIIEGKATWWQMELPSGEVIFGDAKADLLGYPPSRFKHVQDFTRLLHPSDHDKASKALKDHLEGKAEVYGVLYRIKHRDGHYLTFYDCGQIFKRAGDDVSVIGFVWTIEKDEDSIEAIENIKRIVLRSDPSMMDLVKNLR